MPGYRDNALSAAERIDPRPVRGQHRLPAGVLAVSAGAAGGRQVDDHTDVLTRDSFHADLVVAHHTVAAQAADAEIDANALVRTFRLKRTDHHHWLEHVDVGGADHVLHRRRVEGDERHLLPHTHHL